MLKIKKIAIINCLFLSSFFLNPFGASNFDLMGRTASAQQMVFGEPSDTYGARCSRCRGFFGQGFCQKVCCESCVDKDTSSGGDGSSCQSSICGEVHAPTQAELNRIQECMDSNYSMPGCNGMREYLSEEEDTQNLRDNQRRAESCDRAVAFTARDCTLSKLDQGTSGSLFNTAKQITNVNSCDALKGVGFDLNKSMIALGDPVIACQDNHNDCKRFCFDENTVQNGSATSFDDPEDQQNYESICSPKYEAMLREANKRKQVIYNAQEKKDECQSPDEDFNDPSPLPRTTSPTATPNNPNSPANNPEVALNRLNQLSSLVQPFITPQNTSNYNPGLYSNGEVANDNLYSNGQGSSLSYEEKYGPQYQGYDPDSSDDYGYIENTEFDKPDSLKASAATNAQNPNRPGQMGGGNFGGPIMGGSGGSSGNGSNPSSKAGGKGRKVLKDKSMFGKITGSTGGSGLVEAGSKKDSKAKNRFSSNSKKGSKGNGFNASKYHAQIMASYNRGQDSRAQVLAQRRAAGLKVETFDEKRKKGYLDWHHQHKLHPETISLFMQARICYNAKFRSDFTESCEFK